MDAAQTNTFTSLVDEITTETEHDDSDSLHNEGGSTQGEPDFLSQMMSSKSYASYMKNLIGEVVDAKLGKRLDYCEGQIHELSLKVENMEKNDECKSQKIAQLSSELRMVKHELNDLEQYGRRNNLRINGLAENDSEDTNEEIKKFAKEHLHVELVDSDFDRSHRVGKPNPDKPRAILVKFTSYRARKLLITQRRQLKGTRLSIHEDLTKKNQTLLKETSKQTGVVRSWSQDGRIFASILTSTPGKLAKMSIRSSADFRNLPTEEDYKLIIQQLEAKTNHRDNEEQQPQAVPSHGMVTRNRSSSQRR